MKKAVKIAITFLTLTFLIVSCGDTVSFRSCRDSGNGGQINVYSTGGSSKALSGSYEVYPVPSRRVVESDFRSLDSKFEGRTIYGLEFINIISIEGEFVEKGEALGKASSLTDLVFCKELESIGELSFRTSYGLQSVLFKATSATEVAFNAFPEAGDYYGDCAFEVEGYRDLSPEQKEAYKRNLRPFIDDKGYLKIAVDFNLDLNEASYAGDPDFGTPSISSNEFVSYVGKPVENMPIPVLEGWDFTGYYLNADTTETQLFTSSGNAVPDVGIYTDSEGNWKYETVDPVKMYAHWVKHQYTVFLAVNDSEGGSLSSAEPVTGVEFGTKLSCDDKELVIPTVNGNVVVTVSVNPPAKLVTYSFDSWENGDIVVRQDTTVTAIFTSYSNPNFEPIETAADTIVDIDLGDERVGFGYAKHEILGINIAYHETALNIQKVQIEPYSGVTNLVGIYTTPDFDTCVINNELKIVTNISGYTDETGWNYTGSDSPVRLYAKWN